MLHDLVEEDDRVVEAWYLLSMATLAGDELEEAADATERGMAVCRQQGMATDDPMWLAFEGTKVSIWRHLLTLNAWHFFTSVTLANWIPLSGGSIRSSDSHSVRHHIGHSVLADVHVAR